MYILGSTLRIPLCYSESCAVNVQSTSIINKYTRGNSRSSVDWFPEQLQYQGKFRDLWKEELIPVVDLWSRGSGAVPRSYWVTSFFKAKMIPTIKHNSHHVNEVGLTMNEVWWVEPIIRYRIQIVSCASAKFTLNNGISAQVNKYLKILWSG